MTSDAAPSRAQMANLDALSDKGTPVSVGAGGRSRTDRPGGNIFDALLRLARLKAALGEKALRGGAEVSCDRRSRGL